MKRIARSVLLAGLVVLFLVGVAGCSSKGTAASDSSSTKKAQSGGVQPAPSAAPKEQPKETQPAPDKTNKVSFIGAEGSYYKASEASDLPAIRIGPAGQDDNFRQIDIIGTYTKKVYYKGLRGEVIGSNKLEVPLAGSDAVLLLTWDDPGTITVSKLKGTLPTALKALLVPPTYWNSEYLKTS